jgi:gamma-butyrobetaine dioxygenase
MTRVQVVSGDLLFGGRRFPAVWLRDNCPGPECHDPQSGQKLFGITDIPNEIVVSAAGETGAAWLARWFPAEVTEPVRLHVAAKRYLCTVVPGYFGRLSAASVYTLSLQGGPMDAGQAAAFEALPHAAAAVAVRRWDEAAKDPAVPGPPFDHFRPLLASLLRVGA